MSRRPPLAPSVALGTLLLAQAGAARAATPPSSLAPTPPPVPAAPATVGETTPSVAEAPAPAAPETPGVPVEGLPASAFPEPQTRGLRGGSMWLNFHGLQWPYIPRTGIGVSGSAWTDNSFRQVKPGAPGNSKSKELLNQTRVVLRVTPTYNADDWFVQAQAEVVGNSDQTQYQPRVVAMDDLWLRTGSWNKWDITVGRFEGWEVYHFGMALDLNTQERIGALDPSLPTPQIYGLNYAYLRPNALGNVAFHAYPTEHLRFEALMQTGAENGNNALGGRGVGIFDLGWFKLKGGGEYIKKKPTADGAPGGVEQRGWSGSAQFVLQPWVEFGANFGYALQDVTNSQGGIDAKNSFTDYSVGGFANVRAGMEDLLVGVGADYTNREDIDRDDSNKVGKFTHTQGFGAVQYLVKKKLFVKLVLSYAKSHMDPSRAATTQPWDNTMMSARLRLMYLF